MSETPKDLLRRIADPIIFGNFFIAGCAAGLVTESYLLLGYAPVPDELVLFVFFSTLLLYNFHRLMGVRRIKQKDYGAITGWAARHQFTLLMLNIIALGGLGFFFFQLQLNVVLTLIPLAVISAFYELPLVKFDKRFERLRNIWIGKAFFITAVWAATTAILPALNILYSLKDPNVWLILAERMLFIFIIALCFDMRDEEFDRQDNLKTIPVLYGQDVTKRLYRILSILFFLVSAVHYFIIQQAWGAGIAMSLSIVITYMVVMSTIPRKSDYYYMFIVDGMMLLQFLLVWLAGLI